MKNAWDLVKAIPDWDKRQSIENRLHAHGGWRTFFDPHSHQWTETTIDQKLDFLNEIMEATGSTMEDIVLLYKMDYGGDRPDIAHSTALSLPLLLERALTRDSRKETHGSQMS